MSNPKDSLMCPHCGQPLKQFEMPENSAWRDLYQWACFNNDCPYYRSGWDWMWENYQVKASYRYRVTEEKTGSTSPLAVWSETALIDRIIKDNGSDTSKENS
jgi:hypothetical protein